MPPLRAKVPEVTALFWVIKVLTTGMGEAMSDFLANRSIPLAVVIGFGGFVVAMALQFRARQYRPPVYWFAVMMVAVFGTIAADAGHKGAGIPYAVTTPLFAAGLAVVFVVWSRTEHTLSIHSITTTRREAFYWTAVLATFALGTATGDLTALTLNLGFLGSAILFAGVIAVPFVLWRRGLLHPVAAFWAAYVVTRPLGASLADWLGKPSDRTGLGLGDGTVSLIAFAIFAMLVAYLTVRQLPRGEPQPAES